LQCDFQVFSRCVPFFRLALFLAGAMLMPACGTVDVGPDTEPPSGCNAPPAFFVSDVWPKYFGNYTCGRSDCHDASTGHGFFRLQDVSGVPAPNPTDPVSTWPAAWAANLRAVETNVSCANPTGSICLIVPEGKGQPHPPGNVVTDQPGAEALFRMWLQ
jgi:hypothetical protein